MCLELTKPSRRPKTARKDIIVYKVLNVDPTRNHPSGRMLFSPYRLSRWEFGKLRTEVDWKWQESQYTARRHGTIDYGLHACQSIETAVRHGVHHHSNRWVFKAVIPKGAEYYLGDRDDIVSNEMMVTRLLTRKEINAELDKGYRL